jgi:hypothetical protein
MLAALALVTGPARAADVSFSALGGFPDGLGVRLAATAFQL